MRSTSDTRRPARFAPVLIALSLIAGACGAAAAANTDVVSVAALPYGGGTYRVSVLFPTLLRDGSGKAAVEDLWRRSGWEPGAVKWIQIPAVKLFPAETSVEFSVNTLYPRGEFPIEALAMAFKQWGGVYVTVAHDGRFRYTGEPHYENADATMDVSSHSNALNVFVRIKNPGIQSLKFATMSAPPTPAAPGTAPARRPARRVPAWIVMLIALPLAGLSGVFVYLYLDAKRNKA
ncbi:MAG TPA: hypothetical protein VGM51_03070 [Armatimonadota bacterium]|jgi:hypothetical protein